MEQKKRLSFPDVFEMIRGMRSIADVSGTLVGEKYGVASINQLGETFLHWAARNGDTALFWNLIQIAKKLRVDVFSVQTTGTRETPAHFVAKMLMSEFNLEGLNRGRLERIVKMIESDPVGRKSLDLPNSDGDTASQILGYIKSEAEIVRIHERPTHSITT